MKKSIIEVAKSAIVMLMLLVCLEAKSNIVVIRIDDNPSMFSFHPNSVTVSVGDVVRFIDYSGTHGYYLQTDAISHGYPSGAAVLYHTFWGWDTCDYVVTKVGVYYYQCCENSTCHTDGSFTAIAAGVDDNLQLSTPVKIYPNPFVDKLNLEVKDIKFVEIYNMLGAKVYASEYTEEIPLSHLPNGQYLLVLIGDKPRVSIKIIKE